MLSQIARYPNALLYLSKNKQSKVVNENSINLNQMKLMFRIALGSVCHRGEKYKISNS